MKYLRPIILLDQPNAHPTRSQSGVGRRRRLICSHVSDWNRSLCWCTRTGFTQTQQESRLFKCCSTFRFFLLSFFKFAIRLIHFPHLQSLFLNLLALRWRKGSHYSLRRLHTECRQLSLTFLLRRLHLCRKHLKRFPSSDTNIYIFKDFTAVFFFNS